MAVTQAEMHGWPRGKWTQGEFDGTRRIMCFWTDAAALLAELDTDPFWPDVAYPFGPKDALIRQAEVVPFGKSTAEAGSTTASYQYAIVNCLYSTRGPKWDAINNMYVEEVLDPAFHSFAVDPTNLRWDSDNKQVMPNDAPIDHDVLYEYRVYFHNLTSLPAWVLSRPGLCNSNSFPTARLGIVFAPETLKYMGCTIHGRYSLAKLPRYDLVARFTHKWSEWNKFWRPDKVGNSGYAGTWEKIKTKAGDEYKQHPPVYMDLI
jgi:hypothetical protein